MPVFLCHDPFKGNSYWSTERQRYMTKEFVRFRIKYFSISSPEELKRYLEKYDNELSSLVLSPADEKQYNYLLSRYGEFNIHKIFLSNYSADPATSDFSSVISNFHYDMKLAISHLKEKGCKKIALFNASENGYHDRLRIETYKQLIYHDPLIFFADKTVHIVLSKLLSCDEKIDAIICINDFSAFCLMLVLNEIDSNWREKISVLSFANTILSSLCPISLTSVSMNYAQCAKEVATIHKLCQQNDQIAYMHIVIKNHLYARETTAKLNPGGIVFAEHNTLSEENLMEITAPSKKCHQLEKMLTVCDETDLKIIHGLLISKKAETISKNLYLSYEAVKHRVRKMKKLLDFATTAELSAWLKLWIDPNKLEEKIIREYGEKQ